MHRSPSYPLQSNQSVVLMAVMHDIWKVVAAHAGGSTLAPNNAVPMWSKKQDEFQEQDKDQNAGCSIPVA